MDDVRQLLHHILKVGLQALVILELVLLDDSFVDVERYAARLDEASASIKDPTFRKQTKINLELSLDLFISERFYLKTSFSSFTFLLPDEFVLLSSRNALAYAMGPAFTCRKRKHGRN